MNDRHRLERLMALRQRRERRAEAALLTQRQRCQEQHRHLAGLDDRMARQRSDFDRLEREWFEAMQGAALSAQELEQARQALEDHYRQQADLAEARRDAEHERQRRLAERERCAGEWARLSRARQALGGLLERRQRADRLIAEGRADMERDDLTPWGGSR